MTALALVIAAVLGWAYGWPAGALCALAECVVFVATARASDPTHHLTDQEHTLNRPQKPSPTDPGVIRRRARRLGMLGVISSCEPNGDPPTGYTVITAAGDMVDVTRRDMPAYLSGLQHGHRAATVTR